MLKLDGKTFMGKFNEEFMNMDNSFPLSRRPTAGLSTPVF